MRIFREVVKQWRKRCHGLLSRNFVETETMGIKRDRNVFSAGRATSCVRRDKKGNKTWPFGKESSKLCFCGGKREGETRQILNFRKER